MTDTEKLARVVEASQQRNDMFYTPEDKKAMDEWIEAMPPQMPTSIALMVGFNYAMKQIEALAKGV